jgi:synapsin
MQPDFVLLRNEVYSLPPHDFRNTLMGLEFAQVPCMNSSEAVFGLIERPRVYAALNRLQQRLGKEAFPLISQYYYPNFREMQFTPDYPIVAKVAHGQAGYGKMKIPDHKVFEDLASVMAMSTHYVTAEPFLTGEYDIRIQKVGDKYKCWKRQTISGEWKTNKGTSLVTPLELTEQYKMWADEASTLFGGLDILSVDAVHCEDGKELILEVNGSSSGFMPDTLEEDNGDVRDLVLARMARLYPNLRTRGAVMTAGYTST